MPREAPGKACRTESKANAPYNFCAERGNPVAVGRDAQCWHIAAAKGAQHDSRQTSGRTSDAQPKRSSSAMPNVQPLVGNMNPGAFLPAVGQQCSACRRGPGPDPSPMWDSGDWTLRCSSCLRGLRTVRGVAGGFMLQSKATPCSGGLLLLRFM